MNSATATRYDVTLKGVGPLHVAAIRGSVPDIERLAGTFDQMFGILEDYVADAGRAAGPPMAIYHDAGTGPRMRHMHVELALPVAAAAAGAHPPVRVYDLPPVDMMACTIHKGSFVAIGNAYDALFAWMQDNGYHAAGPSRELYLSCGEGDSADCITEVQVPVTK